MTAAKRHGCYIVVFLAATLSAAVLETPSALAQQTAPDRNAQPLDGQPGTAGKPGRAMTPSAGFSYTNNDFDSVRTEDRELRWTLGAEYFLNREVTLLGRYQHTAFRSNQADSDYDADDLRLGVRLRW